MVGWKVMEGGGGGGCCSLLVTMFHYVKYEVSYRPASKEICRKHKLPSASYNIIITLSGQLFGNFSAMQPLACLPAKTINIRQHSTRK